MAEPQASRETGPKTTTTIHNHITKAANLDLSPFLSALDAFMLSTRQCAYPQLVVTCRSQKRAFSRASLKEMGHKRAAQLFVTCFARAEDFVEEPPGTSWLSPSARRHPPAVECVATFCRAEDGDTPVPLDASGWVDSIGNVRALEVLLTRKTV
ncbi:hypothetical protein B0H17DRAFT_1219881 [Mycena rosella]|uniref:Uncharacterized protein n=1 Tax=Mycena rosella TaxID=1033263 RepID=A0AAD7FHG6_MYCRO|nr:hypothetical protein B0H17DRAFT_1219881 [Mycena rosella]